MHTTANDTPAHAEFERFRAMVEQDSQLFEGLRAASNDGEFVRVAVEQGRARGCKFGAAEVREALTRARRSWSERRLL